MDPFEMELHVIALRASPDCKVLRKLERRAIYERPLPGHVRIGILVDVETTGLDSH